MTRRAALACTLAGAAWLALIPASAMFDADALSYDGYYRVMAVPLLLFLVAWLALRRGWPRTARAEAGYWLTLAGLALVFAGDTLEFWGAWLLDETNARAAYGSGTEAWWGSNVGWTMFGLGLLALFVGAVTAAVAAARGRFVPRWSAVLFGLLGLGILSGNLLHAASPFVTVPAFGGFGLGWVGLGLALWRRSAQPMSRTTS